MSKAADAKFAAALADALAAGAAAGAAVKPAPMVVGDGNRTYFVGDGVCGFGWVNFPGNSAFGRWARKNGHARPDYPKGLRISSKLMTQSLDRNAAWASAAAAALRDHGVDAQSFNRID